MPASSRGVGQRWSAATTPRFSGRENMSLYSLAWAGRNSVAKTANELAGWGTEDAQRFHRNGLEDVAGLNLSILLLAWGCHFCCLHILLLFFWPPAQSRGLEKNWFIFFVPKASPIPRAIIFFWPTSIIIIIIIIIINYAEAAQYTAAIKQTKNTIQDSIYRTEIFPQSHAASTKRSHMRDLIAY